MKERVALLLLLIVSLSPAHSDTSGKEASNPPLGGSVLELQEVEVVADEPMTNGEQGGHRERASPAIIYTWKDDAGKLHYSDEVPEKYGAVAVPFDGAPLNTIAPEPEIKEMNAQAVAAYREQDKLDAEQRTREEELVRLERERIAAEQLAEAQKQSDAQVLASSEQSRSVTREDCRNIYKSLKKRMRCYDVADETRKHFLEQHGFSVHPDHTDAAE